jgi:hypothetical protein
MITLAGSSVYAFGRMTRTVAARDLAPSPTEGSGVEAVAPKSGVLALTGQEVIRRMHDRYATAWYKTLSFTESAEQRAPDGTVKTETWWEEAKLPARLRIDVGYPASDRAHQRRILVFAHDSTYVSVPGKPVQRSGRRNLFLVLGFDVYKQPVERTIAQLTAEGFDLSQVHEGAWRGRPAYVVGAAAGDTTSKQFWIDRDRDVFLRMIEPAGSPGGGITDAWFADYRPLAGGWVAAEVGVTTNGVMQLHEIYDNIKANVTLPDAWFDPNRLP